MRERHKDLFEPMHKSVGKRCRYFLSEGKQWWLIALSVVSFFVISPFINISFLNWLTIKPSSAVYIVDQRTANIATIISITLVVVGFILNNLAVKSGLVFRLLFKKSLLYPIIYLTLTTIACFIAVSTLRDFLGDFVFSRAVLAGTYLTFIILFFIGYLFRTVFRFANDKYIAKIIDEELLREAKRNTKQILLKKYSEEHYVRLMKDKDAKEYDISEAWSDEKPIVEFKEVSHEEMLQKQMKMRILHDLNLKCLSRFFKRRKKGGELFYRKLHLGILLESRDNYIWEKGKPNSFWGKWRLSSSVVLKPQPKKAKDTDEMRKYFDQKLEELSEQSKYRNLETLLESLTKLYEFQMEHQ